MKSQYFARLDSIRFYAVFAVIFAHIFQIWTWEESTVLLFPLGRAGVVVFFVLSGFLITKILLTEPEKTPLSTSFKNFYLRRTLRIFPIYYLYLVVVFSFDLEGITKTELYPWLYLTNFYIFNHNTWLGANSHLWTLSLEEQFYIVWPFLVLLLRGRRQTLLYLFAFIILLSILTRVYLVGAAYSVSPQISVFTLACLDFLAFGGLLALLYLDHNERLKKYAFVAIIGSITTYYLTYWLKVSYGLDVIFWAIGQFSLAVFGGGLILYALFASQKQSFFHNAISIHLGKISYGLYLYHNMTVAYYDKIAYFFGLKVGDYIITKIILSLLFTIVIAQLSYTFIEKPLLKLKHKYR